MDPGATFALLKDQIEKAECQEAAETAEICSNGWRRADSSRRTGSKVVDRIICESTCRAVAAWELV